MSRFYDINLDDPESPRELAFYAGPHGTIRPGDLVTYDNPSMPGMGNPTADGSPMVVAELIDFGDGQPDAILDDGDYQCGAANLRPVGTSGQETGT